jgi:hypothetical protein
MIFARRSPHTPAPLFSRTDGLDMKVSTRQKQGATRHKRRGAIGDNSASSAPGRPQARLSGLLLRPPHRSPNRRVTCHPERSPALFLSCRSLAGAGRREACLPQAGICFFAAGYPFKGRQFVLDVSGTNLCRSWRDRHFVARPARTISRTSCPPSYRQPFPPVFPLTKYRCGRRFRLK